MKDESIPSYIETEEDLKLWREVRKHPIAGGAVQPAPTSDPAQMAPYKVQNRANPEDLWAPLYDRVNIATAVPNSVNFFSTPRGGTATLIIGTVTSSTVKTTRDTNLDTAGQIPARGFQVRGISLHFIPLNPQVSATAGNSIGSDIQLLQYGGYMQWKVGDKIILELPIHTLPSFSRLDGLFTGNNVNAVQPMSERAMFVLGIPVSLQPFDTFVVQFVFTSGITLQQSFDIGFYFHGLVRRPT